MEPSKSNGTPRSPASWIAFHITKEVIKLILMHTGKVSSDDVRFYVSKFDPSAAVIGMAFKALVEEGVLAKKDRQPTDVKSSKSREIIVYSRP